MNDLCVHLSRIRWRNRGRALGSVRCTSLPACVGGSSAPLVVTLVILLAHRAALEYWGIPRDANDAARDGRTSDRRDYFLEAPAAHADEDMGDIPASHRAPQEDG